MIDDFEWDDPIDERELADLLGVTEDERVDLLAGLDRGSASIVEQAIEKMAARLPRDATKTDEQHRADAFFAIIDWYAEIYRSGA